MALPNMAELGGRGGGGGGVPEVETWSVVQPWTYISAGSICVMTTVLLCPNSQAQFRTTGAHGGDG